MLFVAEDAVNQPVCAGCQQRCQVTEQCVLTAASAEWHTAAAVEIVIIVVLLVIIFVIHKSAVPAAA